MTNPPRDALSYLFLDLEATSLDFETSRIAEVCAVGVNRDYEKLFEVNEVVHVPADVEWHPIAKEMAIANGLYEEALSGGRALDYVEQEILGGLRVHGRPKKITLGGSGVANFDKRMLETRMPDLYADFTYFTHDIGERRRGYRNATDTVFTTVDGNKTHRATDDIECHLAEARAFLHLDQYIDRHLREKAIELGINFDAVEPYDVLLAIEASHA